MSCGRRPAPRNVVKWDVGRPAPRPPRTFALMRSPADCVVGGGVPDAPRRGQDPSLRCKGYRGGNGEAAGRACPAPTDCRKRVADERGEGGRQPSPFPVDGLPREVAGGIYAAPTALLFPPAGVRGRLAAHNERRQFASQTRSCGCLPRRGKHCSLPSFAALNCGPGLATPQHPTQKWRKAHRR